jgi:hypothetical protein
MELEESRDELVSIEEFMHWWSSESSAKAGSISRRMAEARDKAFAAEIADGSPMGKLLAAKKEAAAKAEAKADSLGVDKAAVAAGAGMAAGMVGGKAGKLGKLGGLASKESSAKASLSQPPKGLGSQLGQMKKLNEQMDKVGLDKNAKLKLAKMASKK